MEKSQITYLKKCIDNGDNLAQNSLFYFENTLWGKEYLRGEKTWSHAVDCISLDIEDGEYFPAVSQRQARLFVKRLRNVPC